MIKIVQTNRGLSGFTLIEVLVTLVIIAIGLLGLAGLQTASLQNQLEAYQRAQALMVAEEMVNRLRVNAPAAIAGQYTAGTQYGLVAPAACDPNAVNSAAQAAVYDMCDWNNILAGQDESASLVGSLNAARGCIETVPGSTDGETIYRITVAWLGTSPTAAPDSTCGQGAYGDDDAYRRVVSVNAVLADLAD